MIEYIMCYAKPKEIFKFVHNRNLNRDNNYSIKNAKLKTATDLTIPQLH